MKCQHGIPGFTTFLKVIKVKRIPQLDTYYCSHCKKSNNKYYKYDAKLLGTKICPKCGREMKHPISINKVYQCQVCKEIIN